MYIGLVVAVASLGIFASFGVQPLLKGDFQQAFAPCVIPLALMVGYLFWRIEFTLPRDRGRSR